MPSTATKRKPVSKARPAAHAVPEYDVHDLGLAAAGFKRIEWAERQMPVLRRIRERFSKELTL